MKIIVILAIISTGFVNICNAQRADTISNILTGKYRYIEYQSKAAFRFQRTARDLTVSVGSIVVGSISSILLLRYGNSNYRNKAAITTGSVFGAVAVGFSAGVIYNLNMGGADLKRASEEMKKL